MKAATGLACLSGTGFVISLATAVQVAQLGAALISIIAGIGSVCLVYMNWNHGRRVKPRRKAKRR